MPINRNALIRYKVIDRMLRDGRKTLLDELIDACSDAMYDITGGACVSRRTIQHDLQQMRYSEALGYYAPIEVVDKKFYTYSRPDYSITKMPLTVDDMVLLSEAVDVLRQMSAFSSFEGVADVVNRLEDHVASMRFDAEQVILLESNEQLRGLRFITPLHDAIRTHTPVTVTYKPFKNPEAESFCFSPYILKEFRNRWFVFGKCHSDNPEIAARITNLALDRIEQMGEAPKREKYISRPGHFRPAEYFSDMIGVTRDVASPVEHVVFRSTAAGAPYVRTKPLHRSQREQETLSDGSTVFSIDVIVNYELERDILGYGEQLTVLSPPALVERIKQRLDATRSNY